jgi:acetoin:2,6-dichlorophenolindophenol oxidoreductase subunit beta
MLELTYRQAVTHALADAMEADSDVFLLGEDIAAAGGPFKATEALLDRFGPRRVRDTPISEQAIIGAAIGAAAMGLRPVAELMFADFAAVCFDQIVNQLAKYRYMTNGQVTVPVTIRMTNGAAGFAAQHSQAAENWLLNVPGLKIVVPGTPADMYGLLRSAIEDPDPVLVFEHRVLYGLKGEVSEGDGRIPIGQAAIVRSGSDATVVTTQLMRHRAMEAAEILANDGIEIEVIDLRSLIPLDLDTVCGSIDRTNRVVVVQEASNMGSWGANLLGFIATSNLESLDAPPVLIGGDETPIPSAGILEAAWLPSVERIVHGVGQAVGRTT